MELRRAAFVSSPPKPATPRRPHLLMVLAGTTLILKFCACAPARCLPEYTKTSGGVVHTACKQPSPSCVVVKSGLSAADKQILLDTHNKYRSQIAAGKLGRFPPAKDMLRLMWDDEMANNAQALAELCQSTHDKQEERFTTKFQQTGQNIGWSDDALERTDVQASTWVDSWVEEYKDYAGSVSSFDTYRSKGVVTHFVQVAWAKTRFVGCGYAQHKLDSGSFNYQTIVICNYGEWGNQIGNPIYLEGATCSQCPSGSACDQKSGLCVESEETGGIASGAHTPDIGGRRPVDGSGRQRLDVTGHPRPDEGGRQRPYIGGHQHLDDSGRQRLDVDGHQHSGDGGRQRIDVDGHKHPDDGGLQRTDIGGHQPPDDGGRQRLDVDGHLHPDDGGRQRFDVDGHQHPGDGGRQRIDVHGHQHPDDGGGQRIDVGEHQHPNDVGRQRPDDEVRHRLGASGGHRLGGDSDRHPDGGGGGYPGGDGGQPGNRGGYPVSGGGREGTSSEGGNRYHDGHDDTREGHAGEVYKKGRVAGSRWANIFWAPLGFVLGTVFGASTAVAIFRFRAKKSEANTGAGAAGHGRENGVTSVVRSTAQ